MSLKKSFLAAAFTAAFVIVGLHIPAPAFAHEFATQEEVANLKARLDVLEGKLNSQSSVDTDLYALIDELKARLDAMESRVGSQGKAIDNVYDTLTNMGTPE